MARGVPKETQAFIRAHIRSIRQLEALLWVREQEGPVTAAALAKQERIDQDMADDLLRSFERSGFVDGPDDDDAYSYRSGDRDVAMQIDKLAEVYGTYRVSVINLVFSMPSESVQSFADAFKIKRDDDAG